jgi:hypothetical protein
MTDQLKSVAARVRALLAKTVENGATEAEALAAAEKASELLQKYQLTLTDAELRSEGVTEERVDGHQPASGKVDKKFNIKRNLSVAVARFCECKVWRSRGWKDEQLVFLGLRSDAEFAVWLVDSLTLFVSTESARYVASRDWPDGPTRWKARASFIDGCCSRISGRLYKLASERDKSDAKTATGTSLVVVKGALVTEAHEKARKALGLHKSRSRGRDISDGGAFAAGAAAGERAAFGRPVNGNGHVRAIAK